jgi:glycosyltransferase involved in cell wall biosynthesis
MEGVSTKRRSLAAMLICKNEADRIGACLESLVGWVDEIVVLDSGSTDGTVDIAQRYSSKVWRTDWPGFGRQRNRALDKIQSEWVLYIDADERATPQLRAEIDSLLARPKLTQTLFKMRWRTYLLGKPLRFGRFTAPQARLFLREGARFREHEVHESLVLPRREVGFLKGELEHHSWRDVAHMVHKHRVYAELLGRQKFAAGKRTSWAMPYLRFMFDFFQQYVLRLSVLDGRRGWIVSSVLARYAYWKYASLYALQCSESPGGSAALPRIPASAP